MSRALLILLCATFLSSCMEWDYGTSEEFESTADGLFILCEGNFMYGNATLSHYSPESMELENEVFIRANGMKLGDVAYSMTLHDDVGWIVVNNSHVIFAIDPDTFKELGRVTNLTSPRYIHFVSDTKAYVTQLWDNRIAIINPSTYQITGYIECPNMTIESGSTEQMVQLGNYVYLNCWSYQNRILKIDTRSDEVIDELVVGIQPTSIVLDKNSKLWTATDGGYDGSPYGYEAPALYRIDPESLTVEWSATFSLGDSLSELQIDRSGERIYWINDDIWSMSVDATIAPVIPLIESRSTKYYGLTISPYSGEIYVADAIDYQQQGIIYRYDSSAELIDSFYVGVNPTAFCWK